MAANHQDFITRTRQLARDFIAASDRFGALSNELTFGQLSAEPAEGGLDDASDFVGANNDITRDEVLAFYVVLGGLLAGLTDDDRRAIYAVRT
jgi:hypothetical protein